jgi:hypothetical protein
VSSGADQTAASEPPVESGVVVQSRRKAVIFAISVRPLSTRCDGSTRR